MAEKQISEEEDDDEGFGDFKFAPSPSYSSYPYPNSTFNSSQINGSNSFSFPNHNDDNDDEWGDFVDNSSPIAVQSDPFNYFPSANTNPSVPVESEKKQWVKPQGALPLSIFGDEEEEEKEEENGSGVGSASNGGAADLFDRKRGDSIENGSNLNTSMGINGIIVNSFNQNERIKVDKGSKSNSNSSTNVANSSSIELNSVLSPDNKTEQIKAENELNWSSKELNSNSNGFAFDLKGLNMVSNVFNQFEQMKVENEPTLKPNGLNSNSNGLDLDLNGFDSNNDNGNEDFDDEDDGWDFQGVVSKNDNGDGNSKVDRRENSEVAEYTSMFGNGGTGHGSTEVFGVSNGFSYPSNELDLGFDFKPSALPQPQDGLIFDSQPKSKQNEKGNDADGNFWEFKDAFAETEPEHKPSTVAQVGYISDSHSKSKQNETGSESGETVSDDFSWEFKEAITESESTHKEETKVADYSLGGVDASTHDGNMQANNTKPENQKGILPLSLFSDGKLDFDDSLNLQDVSTYNPPSNLKSINTHSSSISFDDLILNLYSQAEKTPSVDSTQKHTENGFDSIQMVVDSNSVNGDDDFDDSSWEFKDAVSDNSAKDQSSVLSFADLNQNVTTKLNVESCVEFYTKLKDELYHVAYFHLDRLKKAKSAVALSGEDDKVAALDEEIQEAYKHLRLENMLPEEDYTEDHSPRISGLNDFLEMLHEPKFQGLELEYHLSRKLSSAEQDLNSAIELFRHATSTLKILTLGSLEEQSNYVSTWFRIISVCSQELRHGASILTQALQKDVHRQIFSELRGQQFITALGEIYRVVEVLGASVKLYKPWVLSSYVDPASIFALLEDCFTLWSSSGLEEALQSISDCIGIEYEGTIKALLDSIKHVHDYQTRFSATQEPTCRMSLLTPKMVPDMKLVDWNGEHYFLKLANLWANLINCDPPKLPHIHVG